MRWIAVAGLSLLVATCGQKGPLTLPEEEAVDLSMLPAQSGVAAPGTEFAAWRGTAVRARLRPSDLETGPAQRGASICLCGASSRSNVATPRRRV